jgi:hypothetical protein
VTAKKPTCFMCDRTLGPTHIAASDSAPAMCLRCGGRVHGLLERDRTARSTKPSNSIFPLSGTPEKAESFELAHIKFFATREDVQRIREVADGLGLRVGSAMLLFADIGCNMAPLLAEMQRKHEVATKRAVIEAKREHGRRVRRATLAGKRLNAAAAATGNRATDLYKKK